MEKGVMLMHKDVNRKKKKTFWRYIFSYLFIFLIPFTLFQFAVSYTHLDVYKRQGYAPFMIVRVN